MKKSIIIVLSVIGMTMSLSANAQSVSNITLGVLGGSVGTDYTPDANVGLVFRF